MTRFCPAERWLRVRMRTKLGHRVPLSPEKGVPVFACAPDLGLLEARERCSRVRMRTRPRGAGSPRKVLACSHANKTSGCRKLEKGARVFACEQDLGELEARERRLRVRMRTNLGLPEARERCSRVRMRTRLRGAGSGSSRKVFACSHANKTSGSWKLEKGARVFACEQEPWLAFLSKWNFFLTASTIFMVGAVGADTSSFLAPSVSDPRFGFHPAWSHQSSLQAFSLSCSGCPVAAVVPVSGSRSSAVSILRSSVVSGCRFFLVSVCRTLD